MPEFNNFDLPRQVPKYVYRPFRDAERLLKIASDLTVLQAEINKLGESPATVLMDREKINRHLIEARRELVLRTPYRICRACLPEDDKCPFCSGRRWIPADTYDPMEIAARMNAFPVTPPR